jgi:hypothetical protein
VTGRFVIVAKNANDLARKFGGNRWLFVVKYFPNLQIVVLWAVTFNKKVLVPSFNVPRFI